MSPLNHNYLKINPNGAIVKKLYEILTQCRGSALPDFQNEIVLHSNDVSVMSLMKIVEIGQTGSDAPVTRFEDDAQLHSSFLANRG